MSFLEIIILAFGLSADAFAVSICQGLSMQKATFKKAVIVGLYFGFFQAVMPIIGFYLTKLFASYITAYSAYIAFALLLLLGVKMIIGSFKKDSNKNKNCNDPKEASLKPKQMLPLAVATSIDALAVGVSLALIGANVFIASPVIGGITLLVSVLGVKLGALLGVKFKSKAELIGGIILVLIGLRILLSHLGIINF